MIRRTVSMLIVCVVSALAVNSSAADTVKVFILAGQSNMEGKAQNILLEHQAKDEKTKAHFEPYRKNGAWVERDDVFIKFLNRHGKLTIGYGSRNRTGAELAFGTVMGNHLDEPVLLIKTAWGGHSLYKLFRSPSAGMPSKEFLEKELENAIKGTTNRNNRTMKQYEERKAKDPNAKKPNLQPMPTMKDITEVYGSSYRNMLKEVNDTFENYGEMFPALKGKKLEIAGFVWFQGWNDQYNGAEKEYASNMKHFIKDVRKDFKKPNLPFVIAMMGQNMSKEAKGPMLEIQEAQKSMESVPEFKGNVRAFRTDVLVHKAAEALYPTWRDNVDLWQKTGSDHAYHYLGSIIWFNRIGEHMAKHMLELMEKRG